MMQLPIPSTPDSLNIPLPDVVERWRDLYLHDAAQKLLVFALIALLLYLLTRLARRLVAEHIEDVNRRHGLRKLIGYTYVALLAVFGAALFADFLSGLGTVLGLLLAGIAFALQDILKSVVGWIYLSGRSGIDVGSRVEVDGIVGDVIDVGVLKTTLLEVGGPLVYGRQATGRLITMPNYKMLSQSAVISGSYNPFVWQEVQIVVPFDSDWQRAEAILRAVGEELHGEVASDLEAGFRRLERRFAFKYGTLTPIVYVTLGTYGVELALRFLVHVRRRRGSVDRVSRRVLTALAQEPAVRFAYPTYRMYRGGESPFGHGGPPGPQDDPRLHQGGEEGLPPPDMLAD